LNISYIHMLSLLSKKGGGSHEDPGGGR
jgi:hypothetical protein